MVVFRYTRGAVVWVALPKGAEDKLGHVSGGHQKSNLRPNLGTTVSDGISYLRQW